VTRAAPRAGGLRRRIGLALACAFLVAVFSLVLFPWERFGARLAQQLSDATGAEVALAGLEGGLSLGGPALHARDVRLRWPDGAQLELRSAGVRPAWSLSWLRGQPAVHVDLDGPAGRIAGTVWPGLDAFDGSVQGLDPAALPARFFGGDFPPLTGRVDATGSVSAADGVLIGRLVLDARDGALVLPESPVAIPFDRLEGELSREPSGAATLHRIDLEGPLVSLEGRGSLAAASALEQAAVDLELNVRRLDPALGPALSALGLPASAARGGVLRISGTLGAPELAFR
jgi:type II secretion system protein N